VNKILMKDCLSKTIAAVDADRLTPYDFFCEHRQMENSHGKSS